MSTSADNKPAIVSLVYPFLTQLENDCLKSLSFDYGVREDAIITIDKGAPHWIFHDVGFQQWRTRDRFADHHGILYIMGHPGTGKSTIMKHMVTQLTAPGTKRDETILLFYFNARSSEDLEKNSVGLFRSLLHQLLMKNPPIPENLLRKYKEKNETEGNWTWHKNEISGYFFEALGRENIKPVTIFIDALDECGTDGTTDEILEIIQLFENAVLNAIKDERILNLCVSGRRFPSIRIKRFNGVNVEDNNEEDLHSYIDQRLSSLELLASEESERQELRTILVKKAGNNFLWAELLTNRLKAMYATEGAIVGKLREELETVPDNLQDLYKQSVKSLKRDQDRKDMLQIMQWVLFSRRPLTAGELRHAMALAGTATPGSSSRKLTRTWQAQIEQLTDNERFADLVRSRTKGLVEIIHDSSKFEPLDRNISTVATEWRPAISLPAGRWLSGDEGLPPIHVLINGKAVNLTGSSGYVGLDDVGDGQIYLNINHGEQIDTSRIMELGNARDGSVRVTVNTRDGDQSGSSDTQMGKSVDDKVLQSGSEDLFWQGRVQVIHESVRNFFIPRPDQDTDSGLLLLKPDLGESYIGLSHENIMEDALKYLALFQIGKAEVDQEAADSLTSIIDLDALSDTSDELQAPFQENEQPLLLNYSANCLFFHSLKADEHGVAQAHLFDKLYTNSNGDILKVLLPLIEDFDLGLGNISFLGAIEASNIVFHLASFYKIKGYIRSLLAGLNRRGEGQGINTNGTLNCSPRFFPKDDYTALMLACLREYESIVKLLLKARVDINARTTLTKQTALHFAVLVGNKSICKTLLSCNADINTSDYQGLSPLFYACFHHRSEVALQLITKGASIRTQLEQNTILQFVFGCYNTENWTTKADDLLKDIMDFNLDNIKTTPLGLAIASGHENLVKMMLRYGAELFGTSVQLPNSLSPLDTAIKCCSLPWVINIMINNDWGTSYNLDKTDHAHGKTIIHWAAEFGLTSLIQELISANASISILDKYGNTPLHYALEGGHTDAAKVLKNDGTIAVYHPDNQRLTDESVIVYDISERDCSDGKTKLHRAAIDCKLDLVQELILAEADIAIKDNRGKTPLDYAIDKGYTTVVRLLADSGGKATDIDARDRWHYKTALHCAAERGDPDLIQALISLNAKIVTQDKYGETPLHYAAEKGHMEAVKLLLDAGARPDINDFECNDFRTPLDCATQNGHAEVVEYLKMILPSRRQMLCDTCDSNMPYVYYHCGICKEGDFDLCQNCVDKGVKCGNENHRMIKRFIQNGKIIEHDGRRKQDRN